ncbi:MAG: LOG family protein [Nocardioidaceae bacterium]
MTRQRGRTVEIETLREFDARVAGGATSMGGWRVQDVDLRRRADALRRLDARGALFLGCGLTEDQGDDLRSRGALVFPELPDLPFDPYRSGLYSPSELYANLHRSYAATPDARVYAWSRRAGHDLLHTLATALHDHAIDDALDDLLRPRHCVGVMGGHELGRDSEGYRSAALLGRSLATSGLTVVTGGGPGAMEAANLGAYLSSYDEGVLDEALAVLAAAPAFRPSVGAWARAAFAVRERWPSDVQTVGIPTWFYGHEPPNPFASHIAKYFANAIREDILLHCCAAGIVFLPGRGGTVQEVFQDACENYYADASTVAPMVLVGRDYWTHELPAWPLLSALAEDRAMAGSVHLVDGLADVPPLLAP